MQQIRCGVVGDCTVGKTCLVNSYISNSYKERHIIPIRLDFFRASVVIDGRPINLMLFDIGSREYMRHQKYRYVDVFLFCFSLIDPTSFENIRTIWYPEVSRHRPSTPIILVGTKLDYKEDKETVENIKEKNIEPIIYAQGLAMSREINAANYLECSALTREGVTSVFDEAIRAVPCPPNVPSTNPKCTIF